MSVGAQEVEEEPERRFAEEPAGEDAPLPEAVEPPSFDAPIEVSEASSELELPNFEIPADVGVPEGEEEEEMPQDTRIMEPIPAEDEIKITATPWLDEVSDARRGDSLEWPSPPSDADRDIQHRERIDTPRIRHLFPVPDSNWDVPHLEFEYDRRR